MRMATKSGAEAIWLDDRIGTLEIGKDADFIVIDTDSHFISREEIIPFPLYSGSGPDVKDVYIQGKPIMKIRNY